MLKKSGSKRVNGKCGLWKTFIWIQKLYISCHWNISLCLGVVSVVQVHDACSRVKGDAVHTQKFARIYCKVSTYSVLVRQSWGRTASPFPLLLFCFLFFCFTLLQLDFLQDTCKTQSTSQAKNTNKIWSLKTINTLLWQIYQNDTEFTSHAVNLKQSPSGNLNLYFLSLDSVITLLEIKFQSCHTYKVCFVSVSVFSLKEGGNKDREKKSELILRRWVWCPTVFLVSSSSSRPHVVIPVCLGSDPVSHGLKQQSLSLSLSLTWLWTIGHLSQIPAV